MRLSVFRGGFSLHAAEQVAGVNLTMLAEFVSKSLIRQDLDSRYQVHELLRQYAQERLELHVEEQREVKENHSRFFARTMHERRDALDRERMPQIREEIRPDINNLKRALDYACTE